MAARMNRRFILRIEREGRVRFQVMSGSREALQLAETYASRNTAQQIVVLDAAGRAIWSST